MHGTGSIGSIWEGGGERVTLIVAGENRPPPVFRIRDQSQWHEKLDFLVFYIHYGIHCNGMKNWQFWFLKCFELRSRTI